jgi:hypothetical protein
MSLIHFDVKVPGITVVALKAKKDRLKQYQELVGGYLTLLPHEQGYKSKWTGYANDEGLLMNLPSNTVAFSVLEKLGFLDSTIIPGAYAGNVILLGKKEAGLTSEQVEEVKAIYEKLNAE